MHHYQLYNNLLQQLMFMLQKIKKPFQQIEPLLFRYFSSTSDYQDPFRVMSMDKLLKLSASKKYQCPSQMQFYTIVMNSLMRRGQQIQLFRPLVNENFEKIIQSAITNISQQSKNQQFLKFSLAIFQGVSNRIFFCNHEMFIQFISEFKVIFKNIMSQDKTGQYYPEIKQLSMYLINLRKGSFLLQDIIQYLKTHAKSQAQILQLIDTLYYMSYKATSNLSKAVDQLLQSQIHTRIIQIKNNSNHVLLDDIVLKVYFKYRLHFKRPFMDVNQWIFLYIKLLKQKYDIDNTNISIQKKISFIKNLLKFLNEIPISTYKRQINYDFLGEIPIYINDLFEKIDEIGYEQRYTKLWEYISMAQVYKDFLFKNSYLVISPLAKTFHEIFIQIYDNFLRQKPYGQKIQIDSPYTKFIFKYIRCYLLFENQFDLQENNSTFRDMVKGFNHPKTTIVNNLLKTVYNVIITFQQQNKDNWQSVSLFEILAILTQSKYLIKNQQYHQIIQNLVKIFNTKKSSLKYNSLAQIRFYFFMKYLNISQPYSEIMFMDLVQNQSESLFAEYAISPLKGQYIYECIKIRKQLEQRTAITQNSINMILCSLKPDENHRINSNIYNYWFKQNQEYFKKVISDPRSWILINVAYRFQFSKINAICIQFICEILRIASQNTSTKNQQNFKKNKLPQLFSQQITKIYRDEIVHNSLITKTDSISEYKYYYLLSNLAEWSLQIKRNDSDRSFVNFRSFVDYTYYAIRDWDNAIRINTFRTRLLSKIVNKFIKKCYSRDHESVNFMKGACLEKIINWIGQFDKIHEQQWLNKVHDSSYLSFIKYKYSSIYCWQILLILNRKNGYKKTQVTNKIQNMIINQDMKKPEYYWKKSCVDKLNLKNIYTFIKQEENPIKYFQILTQYEVKMIVMHKYIALSATDSALELLITKFISIAMDITYKQFAAFCNLLEVIISKNRIDSQTLIKIAKPWIQKQMRNFSYNLPQKYILDYFCLERTFGKFQQMQKLVPKYLPKILQKGDIDIIQFLYLRKQKILNRKVYQEYLQLFVKRNMMKEYYQQQNTIIKTSVFFVYMYASVIFQDDQQILNKFYDLYLKDLSFGYYLAHLDGTQAQNLQKIMLRELILQRKLPCAKILPLSQRIISIDNQILKKIQKIINQTISTKLSSPQDQNYFNIRNTNINITKSAIQNLYRQNKGMFIKKRIELDPQEQLIAIYLRTFISPDFPLNLELART